MRCFRDPKLIIFHTTYTAGIASNSAGTDVPRNNSTYGRVPPASMFMFLRLAMLFPRGSIYTTIMELGPQIHNGDGLLGPNAIIVVYMDPLGFVSPRNRPVHVA